MEEDVKPRHRFMSSYEQRKEAWDKKYQFLLFSAEPYEVVAFKVPNMEVDHSDRFFSHWCCPPAVPLVLPHRQTPKPDTVMRRMGWPAV